MWGCEENGVQSRGWSPVRKLLQSSEWEGMGAGPQVMAVGMEGSIGLMGISSVELLGLDD